MAAAETNWNGEQVWEESGAETSYGKVLRKSKLMAQGILGETLKHRNNKKEQIQNKKSLKTQKTDLTFCPSLKNTKLKRQTELPLMISIHSNIFLKNVLKLLSSVISSTNQTNVCFVCIPTWENKNKNSLNPII